MRWADLPVGTVYTDKDVNGDVRTWTVTDQTKVAGKKIDAEHLLLIHAGTYRNDEIFTVARKNSRMPLGPAYDGEGNLASERYLTYPIPTIEEDPL